MERISKPFTQIFHRSKDNTGMPASSTTSGGLSDPPLTIIELFQSQGCNSCPPTNANLMSLANQSTSSNSNTLLLTYHVTYWDYLGWTDPFGQAAFDQRQRDYVHRMKLRSAFTPQVIVNGRSSGVGNTKAGLNDIIKDGGAGQHMPVTISVMVQDSSANEVVLSVAGDKTSSSDRKLQVSLITFDPTETPVHVKAGENAGKTLRHVNVVKSVTFLGQGLVGEELVFVVQKSKMLRKQVVIVQDGKGGSIVGAAMV